MLNVLKKVLLYFASIFLIFTQSYGMAIDGEGDEKKSSFAAASSTQEETRLGTGKRIREEDSPGHDTMVGASSGSESGSPPKKRQKTEEEIETLTIELTEALTGGESIFILPLLLPESQQDFLSILPREGEDIRDLSVEPEVLNSTTKFLKAYWQSPTQDQGAKLSKVYGKKPPMENYYLTILFDRDFALAFSFNNAWQYMKQEGIDFSAIRKIVGEDPGFSRSLKPHLDYPYQKSGVYQQKYILKIDTNHVKDKSVLQIFKHVKDDVFSFQPEHPYWKVKKWISDSRETDAHFSCLKTRISDEVSSMKRCELQEGLLHQLRYWSFSEVREYIEGLDPSKLYNQILAEVFLPLYLLIPYAPSSYVDWEQVQELQFRLALMAPHHPVALWRFKQLIGSWTSLLVRHLDAFAAVEESREDVTDELGALYEYKGRVEKFHHSLSELERNLNEGIATEVQRGNLANPMFLALQGKKDDPVKQSLQAQNTGEAFWVLGKLAKKREEAIGFYKESARKNHPLGFIGLGNREVDTAGKILLYLEADKLGEHYAWVELAECVIKKPQDPIVKYLTDDPEPTTSLELEAGVNLESPAFKVLREKLRITTAKEVVEHLRPLHLSSYKREESKDSQIPQEVYGILEQLILSHQLGAHFYLRAGALGVSSAYHELARLIEQYSPTSISLDEEGNEEEQQRLSEAGFNLFKESMYKVMSQRGDPWGAYELVGTRGRPELCREAGNFKSYLELAFSHGDKDMYQDALERFRAHFDSVRDVFSESSKLAF